MGFVLLFVIPIALVLIAYLPQRYGQSSQGFSLRAQRYYLSRIVKAAARIRERGF